MGPVRMAKVEGLDEIGMNVLWWFPTSVFETVALPIYKIEDLAVLDFGVQDGVDDVNFFFCLNDGIWRRLRLTTGEGVWVVFLEQ